MIPSFLLDGALGFPAFIVLIYSSGVQIDLNCTASNLDSEQAKQTLYILLPEFL